MVPSLLYVTVYLTHVHTLASLSKAHTAVRHGMIVEPWCDRYPASHACAQLNSYVYTRVQLAPVPRYAHDLIEEQWYVKNVHVSCI